MGNYVPGVSALNHEPESRPNMPVGLMDMVHFMEYYPREWEIMIKKDENDGYRGTLAGASRPQLVGVSLHLRAIVADVLEITKEACLVFAARAH